MFSYAITSLQDSEMMLNLLVSIAIGATLITLLYPYLAGDALEERMKSVSLERGQLRERERAKLVSRGTMRAKPKAWQAQLVDQLNLGKHFGQEDIKNRLSQAGLRSGTAFTTYLVAQLILPIAIGICGFFYMFYMHKGEQGFGFRFLVGFGIFFLAYKLPSLYLTNTIQKRQESLLSAFPDALDLLLICVEAGMSIEVAMKRVSDEIGLQSVPLAEEFALTTAELSYLPDRKQAYENLAKRTNLEGVKSIVLALTQAEKYGTPMGQALRVMAQENRDLRMNEAERKAAAIPPKLTVPMIVFFLPVLFIVILGPPAIRVLGLQ
jgi:tight adherence protein C